MIDKKKTKKSKVASKKKIETPVQEAPKKEVQSYLVPIAFQREPMEKDIPVADFFYHKASNTTTLQCYAPQYEADIEDLFAAGISILEPSGAIKMISRTDTTLSWILNLHKSREFSGNPFIAGEAQEIYED